MYQSIYIDKKAKPFPIVHLFDDKVGQIEFKYQPVAYRKRKGGQYRSIYGDALEKVEKFRRDDPSLFQSDVPAETDVLISTYGDSDEASVNHRTVIIDLEVESKGGYPEWKDPKQPITAIALYDNVSKKNWCWILDEGCEVSDFEDESKKIISCKTEQFLLTAFLERWKEISPTIASGWNIDGFDFPYLYHRLERVFGEEIAVTLSPINVCYYNKYKEKMTIGGINCLDYLLLYKRYSQKSLPNFRLDTVGIEELKVGKVEYEGSLDDLKRDDINKFIEYNIHDIVIVKKLDDKLCFIELAASICHVCHVPYEEFATSSKFLEGALLTYLRRKNLIAPNKKLIKEYDDEPSVVGDDDDDDDVGFTGAYVKDPIPGRYEWVCSADINSLYPSVIMSLNISPETKIGVVPNWDAEKYVQKSEDVVEFADEKTTYKEFSEFLKANNLAIASNGAVYDQNKVGCIPDILKKWFSERVEYKNKMKDAEKAGDKAGVVFWKRRQQIQKILLNSLYGVLGLSIFRFYDLDNALAVTSTGQSIIKSSAKFVNSRFNKRCGTTGKDYVIYIDTDSLYIDVNSLIIAEKPEMAPQDFCVKTIDEVSNDINSFYDILMPRMFNSTNHRIKIVADVVASAAFWLVKKRYAMKKVFNMELMKKVDDVEVKGLDVVRSSYPKKFREFMKTTLGDILAGTTKDILDEKILAFKQEMKTFELADVAKNTSVRFISNTEEKKNFDPKGRGKFTFVDGSTAQCKAALAFNDMLKHFGISDVEPIMNGGKIKWVYLRTNPFGLGGLAFKDDGKDPKKIMDFIAEYSDKNKIWDSELQKKLEDFYKALTWDIYSVDSKTIKEFFEF